MFLCSYHASCPYFSLICHLIIFKHHFVLALPRTVCGSLSSDALFFLKCFFWEVGYILLTRLRKLMRCGMDDLLTWKAMTNCYVRRICKLGFLWKLDIKCNFSKVISESNYAHNGRSYDNLLTCINHSTSRCYRGRYVVLFTDNSWKMEEHYIIVEYPCR